MANIQWCPDCGNPDCYGNGPAALELACPRCGLQFDPRDYCAECGGLMDPEGRAAGETTCLDCAGAELLAEIDLEAPLLARVRVELR